MRNETPVLIVGGDPTGLAASLTLSYLGVQSILSAKRVTPGFVRPLRALYGIEPDGAVLVRPDGLVGWRARSVGGTPSENLERALAAILRLRARTQIPQDAVIDGRSRSQLSRTASRQRSVPLRPARAPP